VTSISFEVLPGEIVGLIGPNGAGKITLLRAITGLLPLKAGRIRFLGQEIQGQKTHRMVEPGMTLIPEGRRLRPGVNGGPEAVVNGRTLPGAGPADCPGDV